MPWASLGLRSHPTGTRSAGYAGGLSPCGQLDNQEHHGGPAGEPSVVSAGLPSGGPGNPTLDSYLHGGSRSPSQPNPDGHFQQEDHEEGLEDALEQEEYEDLDVPVIQAEEPVGEPHLSLLLG